MLGFFDDVFNLSTRRTKLQEHLSASVPMIDLFVTILSDFQTVRVLFFLLKEDELLYLKESLKKRN